MDAWNAGVYRRSVRS